MCLSFKFLNLFGMLSSWGSSNYRPSAPFLYEVASHVKNCHFGDYYYYYGRVVKGVCHVDALEAGGREFEPRPGCDIAITYRDFGNQENSALPTLTVTVTLVRTLNEP